jgi:cytochrome c oxidase assembly protein subunit 11
MVKPLTPGDVSKVRNANLRVAIGCLAFFGGMVGMAYAAVPLYRLFCQITGFGGTPMLASEAPAEVLDQTIVVRFDANTNGVPWEFQPKRREVTVRLGETMEIAYVARNLAGGPTSGTATFNVTPEGAGAYFNKMQCFCFTDTTLQAGETLEMPVVFFVDPDIVNDAEASKIRAITLSYTFVPIETPAAAGPPEQAALRPATGNTTESRS